MINRSAVSFIHFQSVRHREVGILFLIKKMDNIFKKYFTSNRPLAI